jgi:hypothetical protein
MVQKAGFSTSLRRAEHYAGCDTRVTRRRKTALAESAARADELAAGGDHNGEAVWRRITDAVEQLANKTPSEPLH